MIIIIESIVFHMIVSLRHLSCRTSRGLSSIRAVEPADKDESK